MYFHESMRVIGQLPNNQCSLRCKPKMLRLILAPRSRPARACLRAGRSTSSDRKHGLLAGDASPCLGSRSDENKFLSGAIASAYPRVPFQSSKFGRLHLIILCILCYV